MAAAADASPGAADADAAGDPRGCDSACSTPFVSAPSSPSRDRDRDAYPALHGACFFSAPASPTRGGGAGAGGAGGMDFGGCLDFDFDFSSRFPSPSAAAMSSADELFHNGQIRPVRLAAALLQPQPDAGAADDAEDGGGAVLAGRGADERGRVRSRSVRRKARSLSPFRTHWRPAPAAPPAPAPEADEPAAAATPAASRSSSSSSTASSASSASSSSSSSSSRGSRRWGGFLKDLLLHRSKSDGGKTTQHHQHSRHHTAPPPPAASPSPAKGRGAAPAHRGRRRSAHERLYEARRAEAEEMRRRTSLPYHRQGLLLFGCIGLGHRGGGYGAVHGLARGLNAAAAVSSRS